MAKKDEHQRDEAAQPASISEGKPLCGIIMPISESPESPGHWQQVRTLIERAADKAGFEARMVSENDTQDMIHSSIIKNIYHNPVVVCDVSSQNPNVMLELGLRMATKKPLVLIFDGVGKYPFDITNFKYIPYPKGLHFFEIESFVTALTDKIKQVNESDNQGNYKSYLSHFDDLVIEPSRLDVTTQTFADTLLGLVDDVRELKNEVQSVKYVENTVSKRYSPLPDLFLTAREKAYIDFKVFESIKENNNDEPPAKVYSAIIRDIRKNYRSATGLDSNEDAENRFKLVQSLIRDYALDSFNRSIQ